ncbi:MAG: N-6 DNA methylase [Kiritimatiellae bacterium]|nr:N-6 DNA methylase [Kiritimatiellia bacterium]
MKYAEVAENVKQLVENPPPKAEFIYALLPAYGTPKATISRLKAGQLNLAKEAGDVLLKKKVWFRPVAGDLFAAIEELKTAKAAKTNDPRFLIVTDFQQILAIDRKTGDTLDTDFQGLETHFTFFLPWAGMEKTKLSNENPADVKAAEKMAKLFDAIKQDNPDYMRHDAHAMNVFLGRLLFCLFAEDTGIFTENAVSNAIKSYTAEDGSDLDAFFKELFDWLDTPDKERDFHASGRSAEAETTEGTENTEGVGRKKAQNTQKQDQVLTTESSETQSRKELCASVSSSEAGGENSFLSSLRKLPYVNGGLFRDHYDIPVFTAKSRRMLIEAGSLTWAEINPDIFGSMFQAVIDPEERHNLGQHYTSVTNIMKVIEPLFLNDFKEEFERARNLSQKNVRTKALHGLHDRMAQVKIFDPACGSGNFLIIAYKELRKLEMELFEAMNAFPVSRITVDQFYGIEIADFACETATLSLWLAEHQMNLEYQKRFGHSLTSLPLKDGANIVCGNACRIDWETVCPKNEGDEIYILGNPPYLGARNQTADQKADMAAVFENREEYKDSDYVACWFLKGAEYIQGSNAKFAFVSTNSISQGEQVGYLWPRIFSRGLEISFAHQSFKWTNNAKGGAGVTCVIVGVRNPSAGVKTIFKDGLSKTVSNISPYLTEGGNICVHKLTSPISKIPKMVMGNMARDGGHLIMSPAEKKQLISDYPESAPLIRRLVGAEEFIRGSERWCLWIEDEQLNLAKNIPPINERVEAVYDFRMQSPAKTTRAYAAIPHKLAQRAHKDSDSIIVPSTTSERREYIPMGFVDRSVIATNAMHVIYDAKPYIFGFLSSEMHGVWVRAVAGGLETRIRYSAEICYNNFPIPELTAEQKQAITMHVGNVLEEREKHSEKTMAQLYDPDKMPAGLREAHHQLDLAVDRIYRSKPFASDEERLEHLFKLYEEMTQKETLI